VSEDAPAIRTRALSKTYGKVLAVDRIDLEVPVGARYGFLGPNGSGKTTTVRMLLGLVFASSGDIALFGHSIPRAAGKVLPGVGSLIEGPGAYAHLPGRTNLAIFDAAAARRTGRSRRTRPARIQEALERVGLGAVDKRPVKAYSLGMRQRLGIATALLGLPRLLILDEPTNGLDPQGIHEMRDLFLELNRGGVTVFVSSHLLAEVEQLCTHVGVLDRGALVLQAPMSTLRQPTGRVTVWTPDAPQAAQVLDGRLVSRDGNRLVINSADPAGVNHELVTAGVRVESLVREIRSLEQTVLDVTSAGNDRVDGLAR
jgi:ABC-2 type transport system ATP-binding protein